MDMIIAILIPVSGCCPARISLRAAWVRSFAATADAISQQASGYEPARSSLADWRLFGPELFWTKAVVLTKAQQVRGAGMQQRCAGLSPFSAARNDIAGRPRFVIDIEWNTHQQSSLSCRAALGALQHDLVMLPSSSSGA